MHTTDKTTGMVHTYMHQIFFNGHDGTYAMVFSKEGGYFNLPISKAQAEKMIEAFKPTVQDDPGLGHKYYDFASEPQPNPYEEPPIVERDDAMDRLRDGVEGCHKVASYENGDFDRIDDK